MTHCLKEYPGCGSNTQFRMIKGFPGYWVDEHGNHYSCWKHGGQVSQVNWKDGRLVWRLLKGSAHQVEYVRHILKDLSGVSHKSLAHRNVIGAFQGVREDLLVRHLDRKPSNNSLANLAYGTHMDNHQDSVRHGTAIRGERVGSAKLTEQQVRDMRREYASGALCGFLAKKYSTDSQTVSRITLGKSWKHIPLEYTPERRRRRRRPVTEAERIAIQSRILAGARTSDLVEEFDRNRSVIEGIKKQMNLK